MPDDSLTAREQEVADLIAEGLGDNEIASSLSIQRNTIRVHVSNILAKLDVRNRVQIATWAVRRQMAEVEPKPYAPCPFCGSPRVGVTKKLREGYETFKDDPDAYAYFVTCTSCAAQGGWAKSDSGARRWWEMRHAG